MALFMAQPENDSDSETETETSLLPISHQVEIKAHQKGVQALAIDREGTKMISGGLDYQLKIYDFDTMNQNLRPFKDFKPFDGHPITALSWCPTSSHFLVCCPNNQARVYSFDGVKKQTTVRGDMYLHDMANTKGHTAAILDGKWHPKNDNLFITSSSDGTIRQWDLNSKPVGMDQNLGHSLLIKSRDTKGQKVAASSLQYFSKGDQILTGCTDGQIQMYDLRQSFRPSNQIQFAHKPGSEVTSLKIFRDSTKFASRGADNTLKLWDVRNLNKPFLCWEDLECSVEKIQCCFSPNDKVVMTGTEAVQGKQMA